MTQSPYRTTNPARHAAELGRLDPDEVHEFYQPFTMVDDLVELVRVTNPDYGEMDMVVLLAPKPVNVYVNGDAGERFLRERFPTVVRHRVPPADLRLDDSDRGHTITATLTAPTGPVRELALVIRARPGAQLHVERYEAPNVWGSPITCHGIDMRLQADAHGHVTFADGTKETVTRDATLFRGSYGRLVPHRAAATAPTAKPPRTR